MAYNDVVYWSTAELENIPATADIIAIGDSWFWYPMPGGSLLNHIGDLVKPKGHRIIAAGNNGAEAYDYVKGKYKRVCSRLINHYGAGASALLISGGGNDFAGFNDLRPLLKDDCSLATAAADCFREGGDDDEGTVNWLMGKTYENYSLLISRALMRMPATAKIFLHNYDYANASGKGVFGNASWIKPAFIDAGVPPHLYQDCVNFLIDAQTDLLSNITAALPGRVFLVDGRGTLQPDDWANELHPTGSGFKKLVDLAWKPKLVAAGLA